MLALLTAEAAAPDKVATGRSTAAATNGVARIFPWLLLLAFGLRVIAACQPGFLHPDAIFQYLEPAFRLVTGEGVVTWEWRVGMRSWLLPTLLAPPVALGEAIDPRSNLPLVLPRIAMAAASLGIVWAAWRHGRRHSDLAGLLAGFVAAIWFELIYVGVQTLAEPLATVAFLVASVWLTPPRASRLERLAAGALLAAMILLRPHYAPAGMVLVVMAWWPLRRQPAVLWQTVRPVFLGGIAMAAGSAAIDLWAGVTPFMWIVENIRQNIVENVAARYGVAPPLALVAWLVSLWRWWIVPIAIGLRFGWRSAPALCAAAIVTIAIHSLIGHKEYRFIFLATASLLIVSAIGWGEIIAHLRRRWPGARGAWATAAVFVGWGLASILLAGGPTARLQRSGGVIGSHMFATLHADPRVCGAAIVARAAFANFPGQVGLGRGVPQYMFWSDPDSQGVARNWAEVARRDADYNRILTSAPLSGTLPPGYRPVRCEADAYGVAICLYARPGGCRSDPASPAAINRILVTVGA